MSARKFAYPQGITVALSKSKKRRRLRRYHVFTSFFSSLVKTFHLIYVVVDPKILAHPHPGESGD